MTEDQVNINTMDANEGQHSADTTHANVDSGMREIKYNPVGLPRFSGRMPVPKGESSYRVWNHSLQAIKVEERLGEIPLKQLIRRSLIGEAAEVLVSLAATADSTAIITELNDLYGVAAAKVDGWSCFHSATQSQGESVAEWKMRLLRLYDDADPEGRMGDLRDPTLATAFWQGLYNKDLRIATATDRKRSFSILFRAVKENECLYQGKSAKPVKSAMSSNDEELKQLRKEMQQLRLQNDKMREQLNQQHQNQRHPQPYGNGRPQTRMQREPTCFYCGVKGHIITNCPECPRNQGHPPRASKDTKRSEN